MSYQQGTISATSGTAVYVVSYPEAFEVGVNPPIILSVTRTVASAGANIEAQAHNISNTGFSVTLDPAPADNDYQVTWIAGSLDVGPLDGPSGLGLSSIPELTGDIPSNLLFPVALSGSRLKSRLVRWISLRNNLSINHTHALAQISDATTLGRLLMAAVSKSAARDLIDAAAAVHTHTSDDISDATTVGKEVLTAASAGVARTAMNAAESGHTHTASDISDANAIGLSVLTAADAAAARTALDVPKSDALKDPQELNAITEVKDALSAASASAFATELSLSEAGHTHPFSAISDPSSNLSSLQNNSTSAFRRGIGAGSLIGTLDDVEEITGSLTINNASLGKVYHITGDTDVGFLNDFTTPSTSNPLGQIGFIIDAGVTVTILAMSGGHTFKESASGADVTISASDTNFLRPGVVVIHRYGIVDWFVTRRTDPVQVALESQTLSSLKSALAIAPSDLSVSGDVQSFLGAADTPAARAALNAAKGAYDILSYTSDGDAVDLVSEAITGNVFVLDEGVTLTLDTVTALTATPGESFVVYAKGDYCYVQDDSNVYSHPTLSEPQTTRVPKNRAVRFHCFSKPGGTAVRFLPDVGSYHYPASNTLYVSGIYGSDSTGVKGNPQRPFKTLVGAASAASYGDRVLAYEGEESDGGYELTEPLDCSKIQHWEFETTGKIKFTRTGLASAYDTTVNGPIPALKTSDSTVWPENFVFKAPYSEVSLINFPGLLDASHNYNAAENNISIEVVVGALSISEGWIKDVNTLTLASLPSDGLTFDVGSETYTFRTTPTLASEIEIGADIAETVVNIAATIDSEHPDYYAGVSPAGDDMVVVWNKVDPRGNSYTSTFTNATGLTWAALSTQGPFNSGAIWASRYQNVATHLLFKTGVISSDQAPLFSLPPLAAGSAGTTAHLIMSSRAQGKPTAVNGFQTTSWQVPSLVEGYGNLSGSAVAVNLIGDDMTKGTRLVPLFSFLHPVLILDTVNIISDMPSSVPCDVVVANAHVRVLEDAALVNDTSSHSVTFDDCRLENSNATGTIESGAGPMIFKNSSIGMSVVADDDTLLFKDSVFTDSAKTWTGTGQIVIVGSLTSASALGGTLTSGPGDFVATDAALDALIDYV